MSAPQLGGANPVSTFMNSLPPVPYTLYGIALILAIVYVNQIPVGIRAMADSPIGRILGIIGIVLSLRYAGWAYAVLFTVAYILLLHGAPRLEEGFSSIQGKNVQRPTERWFVERVLGERPTRIEIDRVNVEGISDNSQRNMRSVGSRR